MTIYITLITKSIVSILALSIVLCDIVYSTSINYGIHQQPITDINQLMPKLCQNQTMICEGSFCIPGVKKCVCDLRNPVQFSRYCLRQLDMEVQCFVTSQCNHTVKDAICQDFSSGKGLDDKTSRFKLDQWQQLNDLRSQSNMATSSPSPPASQMKQSSPTSQQSFYPDSITDIPISNLRNSPYEIGYMDPYKQLYMSNNDTTSQSNSPKRDKIEDERKSPNDSAVKYQDNENTDSHSPESVKISTPSVANTLAPASIDSRNLQDNSIEKVTKNNQVVVDQRSFKETLKTSSSIDDIVAQKSPVLTSFSTNLHSTQTGLGKKNRQPRLPPGKCSCPLGFIFDKMVRKCLPLSLADARCKSDDDCRHILYTQCNKSATKCSCVEHYAWHEKELLCKEEILNLEKILEKDVTWKDGPQPPEIFIPNLNTLLIFSLCAIFGTASFLIITYKCFSTKTSSTLIAASDRDKRKKRHKKKESKKDTRADVKNNQFSGDTKPSSHLSNITKATRGRILNYDFETSNVSPVSSVNPKTPNRQNRRSISSLSSDTTVKSLNNLDCEGSIGSDLNRSCDAVVANATVLPPSPIPSQPHYMMTSTLKGASAPCAIAAAAAAAARKRKERQSGHQTDAGGHKPHDPVFL